jgi:hypothetical protein
MDFRATGRMAFDMASRMTGSAAIGFWHAMAASATKGCRLAMAALAMLASASATRAQVSVFNLIYESPTLFAPVAILQQPIGNGALNLSLSGYTAGAEYRRATGPFMEWTAGLEATPIKAHRSDAFYAAGERAPDSGYDNGSYQIKGGFKRKHSPRWTGEYRVSALYEVVSGLPTDEAEFWDRPYAGLTIGQAWERVRSFDPLLNRWDGVKAVGQYQFFAGEETWWRGSAALGLGRRMGPVFLRGDATVFQSDGLNTVSRFLVGGGWELPGVNALYGYRYGEFRIGRGLLSSAAVDWNFAGKWELGLRGGLLADWKSEPGGEDGLSGAPELIGYGEALRLGGEWHGMVFALGLGVRRNPLAAANLEKSVVSASWTTALWNPFTRER